MSERNRGIMLSLLVAIEGALLALIGFAGMDELIGFGAGFGAAMIVLGLIEAGRRLMGNRTAQ